MRAFKSGKTRAKLGTLWATMDHIGAAMGQHQGNIGAKMGQQWGNLGATLGQHWATSWPHWGANIPTFRSRPHSDLIHTRPQTTLTQSEFNPIQTHFTPEKAHRGT